MVVALNTEDQDGFKNLVRDVEIPDEDLTDVAKQSTLSADAKEWYPPGYKPSNNPSSRNNMPSNSVQNRLNRYRQPDNDGKQDFDKELAYLYTSIKTMTERPGTFDELVFMVMDFLEPHFQDIEIISRATAAIFKEALQANFRYNGVRLLALMDENCPLVRGCLHSLCEIELESTENLKNLTLFYAEVFTQMNYELFGKCLLKALKKLAPLPDNAICICQTLKLTGKKLEALDKSLLTDIMNQLNRIRPAVPSSVSNMIENVVKLRDSRWGEEPEVQAAAPPAEPYEWSDGPVFYGPDGMQLTSEESEFLAENLNDFILDDTDPDALWNPEPEMNEEIQAAFAEFVRANNR